MNHYMGKSIPRVDGFDKVTGQGRFTTDIYVPRMLYAKVLRSPYAHAKIVSIDISEAEALKGVHAVSCCTNTTRKLFNTSATMVTTARPEEPVRDQQLFPDVVRYIGDEVAAVAAETEEIAMKALALIKVEYENLPAVYDPIEAIQEGAPDVHSNLEKKNLCMEPVRISMGDSKSGFLNSDVITEVKVKLPRQKQAQMETHSALAEWKHNGNLFVTSTTQTPHPTKMLLAYALDISESHVHVSNPPYVGGGFGVRIGMSGMAEIIVSVLAQKAKRPVQICYTREEDFLASDTRHGGIITAKLGAKRDGTFVAMETIAYLNTGAYATFGTEVPGVLGACGTAGTYRIPNLEYTGYSIYTHQQTAGAFRGFGTPQGTFCIESVVDEMAKELNIDPIELRLKNTTRVGDKWFFPFPCASTGLNECLTKVAERVNWKVKRAEEKTGVIRRGVGVGAGTHVSNAFPFCVDYDAIYLRIEGDGSLHVASGIPEIGPGSTTALLQIAADVVGVPMETSYMIFGDTDSSPFDIGSHATRTLYAVGNAIKIVGSELQNKILDYASVYLEKNRDKLEIDLGTIYLDGQEIISLQELAYEAHLRGVQFLAQGCELPPNTTPWHAQAAEVEVDMETGIVKVLRIVAAQDVGRTINPVLAESQLEGGVMQGVGYAIGEEMTYIEGSGFYNSGFHKYMLPTADDRPDVESILIEEEDPLSPFGLKGIGECGVIPTAPAIVSAVENAIGIRFYELPLTPERVLKRINEEKVI